jgi:hypothetical protein
MSLVKKEINQISLKEKEETDQFINEIVQSYIITAAGYDFSVYEKYIILNIIKCFQSFFDGKKLDKNFSIKNDFYGDIKITLPISLLLVGKKYDNYTRTKKALDSLLSKKIFVKKDNKTWKAFTLIVKPEIISCGIVQLQLHKEIYSALLDFANGYRRCELEVAMSLKSIYSMRFYELFFNKKNNLTYSVETLKSLLQLKDKYKYVSPLIHYVINPAKKELDSKSPYSFNYKLEYEQNRKQKGRKKVVGITFIPVYYSNSRYKKLSYKNISNNIDLTKILIQNEINAFFSFGLTENDLKTKYYDLIQDISIARTQGKIIITPVITECAKKFKNSKTYFVKFLKKEIKQWKENLLNKSGSLSPVISTNKEINNYDQENYSICNFLKNHIKLSIEELESGIEYVIKNGGTVYLNNLIHIYDGNNEKLKIHIKNEIEKYISVHQSIIFVESKTKYNTKQNQLLLLNKVNYTSETISDYTSKKSEQKSFTETSKNIYEQVSETNSIQEQLKKNWEKIVIKSLNLREKLGYAIRLYSKDYLKKKAEKNKIDIYINE